MHRHSTGVLGSLRLIHSAFWTVSNQCATPRSPASFARNQAYVLQTPSSSPFRGRQPRRGQPRNVQQLARYAVGPGGVHAHPPLVSDNPGHEAGEIDIQMSSPQPTITSSSRSYVRTRRTTASAVSRR
jgi:hypothetical protein